MSQDFPMPEAMLPSLEEIIVESDHIVELKFLDEKKEYRKVIFPKETHFKKEKTSSYAEYVYSYKVLGVLSSSSLKVGDIIWLWTEPSYNEEVMRIEHEQGVLESPFSDQYKSKFLKNKNESSSFYFLKNLPDPKTKDTYQIFNNATEGLDAKKEIIEIINKSKEKK